MDKTFRSNSKTVKLACQWHVTDYYGLDSNLIADYNAVNGNAKQLVEDGNFLISYYDQREFLNSLHLNNNSGREFTDDEVFKMYVHLISTAINDIIKSHTKVEV